MGVFVVYTTGDGKRRIDIIVRKVGAYGLPDCLRVTIGGRKWASIAVDAATGKVVKDELRALGSLVMRVADEHRVVLDAGREDLCIVVRIDACRSARRSTSGLQPVPAIV